MIRVNKLTVNTTQDVIGIIDPVFSWQLQSDERGVMQKWFKFQIATDSKFEKVVWNYMAYSNHSTNFKYIGPTLVSSQRYYARVLVKTETDEASDWSTPIYFETPLLSTSDWRAEWIAPVEPQKRLGDRDYRHPFVASKRFSLKGEIRRARLYISALGVYDAQINNKRVSEDYFRPGFTDYNRAVQFQSYDVTSQLALDNEISVLIGEGWYTGHVAWDMDRDVYGGQNALIAQLMVWYEDGTSEIITTDDTWRMHYSDIQFSSMYDGEYLDQTAHDDTEYDLKVLPFSKKMLVPQVGPAVQEIETLKPKRMFRDNQDHLILDMGENMVGWVRFRNTGKASKVVLRHAEVLDSNGNFYDANLRNARATDTYVFNPSEINTEYEYQPHFTYHGFRFVCLEGFGETVNPDDFTGVVLSSATEEIGHFKTDNPLLNQLQSNIRRSQLGNFFDIPTDCPQRDERMGWTADLQIFQDTASFNRNIDTFLHKWLQDLEYDQKAQNGAVPVIVPDVVHGLFGYGQTDTTAAWGDAACIVPWMLYEKYGDTEVLAAQYNSMKSWVDYIRAQGDTEELWDTGLQLADWVALDAKEGSYYGATDGFLASTAYYAYSTKIMAETAKILRKMTDYKVYHELYKRIVSAYQDRFLPDGVHPITNTQTASVITLYFGLSKPENRQAIADNLVTLLKQNGMHMNTGFIGTPYLCNVLSTNNHRDVAYELLFKDDFPSWLYQVKKGATSTWEHWDGEKPDGSFWSTDMNSFNHYAYGSIGEWMYEHIGGVINKAPGYQKSILAPQPDAKRRVTAAECYLESEYGQVGCEWKLNADQLEVKVTIPANTTGYVILPGVSDKESLKQAVLTASDGAAIFSDGQAQAKMVTFMGSPEFAVSALIGKEKKAQVLESDLGFELGSGTYTFAYPVALNESATF